MHWSDRSLFALAVLCYGLSTLYAVLLRRQGFQRDDWVNWGLLLAGGLAHTAAMLERGYSLHRCPMSNLYEATAFIAWTLVVGTLLLGLGPRLRFLAAFVSPWLLAVGVFALMPALDSPAGQPMWAGGWPSLHKALILLAYGSFGLGAAAGLMYLTQSSDLKNATLRAILSRLPPIARLETSIRRALLAGLGLLTAGLVLGVTYLRQKRGVYLSWDAEVVYSVLVWLIYLALLVGRWRFAQRGRRLAWAAVGSFVFLMLTFWGIFLLSAIHNPPQPVPAAPAAARGPGGAG